MAKRKLERFAENATFPHFFQPTWEELQAGFPLRGNWKKDYFMNDHPLIIEVGCGKGEYTVDLAGRYPSNNYIGLDKKGARMWRGAKTTHIMQKRNVAFIRVLAENLPSIFAESEIDEIWITFPEPQPNSPRAKKRFTSPQFLARFRSVLKAGGVIHLKTDNDVMFQYTLDVIREFGHQLLYQSDDLYLNPEDQEVKDVIPVKTHYEKIWLEQGLKIKYLRFSLGPL
ncbi:MAG: tRNA (guanosine(46)-N7)-methyltransferase TrmB [Bacteroidales bacterium]|nr:tRNA (guanosine(46)-N7)-methyltransferase TrmB [Bacteroidales bacterium]